MKALVMYDSAYGNTAKVADAVATALTTGAEVKKMPVTEVNSSVLVDMNLVVVGSPTQGGRPMKPTQDFMDKLDANALKGVRVAAFDTRMDISKQNVGLRIVMKTIGYAAPKIAKALKAKGGTLVADPEGFIVNDKEGPLGADELTHARRWAQSLLII